MEAKEKEKPTSTQQTLDKEVAIYQNVKFPVTHNSQIAITNAIIQMLITDIRPLYTVENEGFKNLIKLLEPRYTMVSRQHIQKKLIPKLFDTVCVKLKALLDSAGTVNITLDIWSNRRMHSYLGITCHFLTESLELKSLLLSCNRLYGRHTGEHILSEFDRIASTFNITDKIFQIVTDNASNMRKAFPTLPGFELEDIDSDSESESSGAEEVDEDNDVVDLSSMNEIETNSGKVYHRLSCFAHTIQLSVKDGINECRSLTNSLKKASRIVSHFHKSTIDTESLENVFDKVLIAKNETRWNSQLMMVRRLIEADDASDLNSIISNSKRELLLTASDKSALRELVNIFDQFEVVSKLVQGEKYASISLALPSFIGLKKHLESINVRRLPTLVTALQSSLERRLSSIQSNPIYIVATCLDPEFKLKWCSDTTEISNARNIILKELEKVASDMTGTCNIEEICEETSGNQPPSKKTKLFSFMSDDHISKEVKSAQQEFDDYLQLVHTKDEIGKGSLEFWKNNGSRFPIMKKLAMMYLSIPASSAPIERYFSTAGKIMRQDRARLLPKNFEKLIFLKVNSSFY